MEYSQVTKENIEKEHMHRMRKEAQRPDPSRLYVDGKLACSLKNGSSEDVEISEGSHTVQTKIWGLIPIFKGTVEAGDVDEANSNAKKVRTFVIIGVVINVLIIIGKFAQNS